MGKAVSIVRWGALLCVGSALTACQLDFSLPTQATAELSVYQSGQQIFKSAIRGDDPLANVVNGWIATHSDGWEYAFITRPSMIYLRGKNFSVNIREHEVSVKYCRGTFNCHFFVKANEELFSLVQNTSTLRNLSIEK